MRRAGSPCRPPVPSPSPTCRGRPARNRTSSPVAKRPATVSSTSSRGRWRLASPSRSRRGPRPRIRIGIFSPGCGGAPVVEIAEIQEPGARFGNRVGVIALAPQTHREFADGQSAAGQERQSRRKRGPSGGGEVTSCDRNGRSRSLPAVRRRRASIAARKRPRRRGPPGPSCRRTTPPTCPRWTGSPAP